MKFCHSGSKSLIQLALTLGLVLTVNLPVIAGYTATDIENSIKDAKILAKGFEPNVYIQGSQVAITLRRHPDAKEEDCKIDAVLMAKAAMDAAGPNIERFDVTFYEPDSTSRYTQVSVNTKDLKDLSAGKLSKEQLLAKCQVHRHLSENTVNALKGKSYGQILNSVNPGPYEHDRVILQSRIRKLEEKHVEVRPCWDLFLRIEDRVANKMSEQDIANLINELSQRLDEEEDILAGKKPGGRAAHKGGKPGGQYPGQNSGQYGQYSGQNPAQMPAQQGYGNQPNMVLGALAPVQGPLYGRRVRIGARIKQLQAEGQDVSPYMNLYQSVDKMASMGYSKELELRIKILEAKLGMSRFGY